MMSNLTEKRSIAKNFFNTSSAWLKNLNLKMTVLNLKVVNLIRSNHPLFWSNHPGCGSHPAKSGTSHPGLDSIHLSRVSRRRNRNHLVESDSVINLSRRLRPLSVFIVVLASGDCFIFSFLFRASDAATSFHAA